MALSVIAIAAMDHNRVIGGGGKLPWHLPEDLKNFSESSRGHTVLMGRKTYESIPAKFRPLPGRKNIVISSSLSADRAIELWKDPRECIEAYRHDPTQLPSDKLWIIGGAEIYRATLPLWDAVSLTLVPGTHAGDAYFPEFEAEFVLRSERAGQHCTFRYFERVPRVIREGARAD